MCSHARSIARSSNPRLAVVVAIALMVSGCAELADRKPTSAPPTPASAPAPAAATAPAPPPVVPYAEAVLNAANALLANAAEASRSPVKIPLIIDPLIDGMTGAQTIATQNMGAQIIRLIREKYPQFDVERFSAASVARQPLVLVGTLTPVNKQRQTAGEREAYRICLAMADLKTGKLVSKGLAFAQMPGVDATPTRFFQDVPAWTEDPATLGYIRTCQGTKAGDPINALYVDRIVAAAQINDAIDAYNAGRFQEARDLYASALRTPGGDQFRVYSGLYLANWKLGHREAAVQAFGQLVDHSLQNKRLAVKFLFRPGSTAFVQDPTVSSVYPLWIKEIATQALKRNACLEVVGNTSPTGPEPMNQRLSLLRAEYIRERLTSEAPPLAPRTIANGLGSSATLIGTGKDDASDALDRRVEFKVIGC